VGERHGAGPAGTVSVRECAPVQEDREKSLKAGMDGLIAKPLKVQDLVDELKKFVK